MNLIGWLLTGIVTRGAQRPLVLITMVVATLIFGGAAVAALIMVAAGLGQSNNPLALAALGGGFSILFGGLAGAAAYMVMRCFDPD